MSSENPERSGAREHPAAEPPGVQYVGDAVTTGSIPVITDDMEAADLATAERPLPEHVAPRFGLFIGLSVVLGCLAGVGWWLIVPLTEYEITANQTAVTTERGLSLYYASDAWFVVLGLGVGAALGILGVRWFGRLGWSVNLVVILGSVLAALFCWGLGWLIGPGDFDNRIAVAQVGELVPIALSVRGPAALLAWPLAAVTPVLLWSSLARDDEEPGPLRLPWRR